MWKLLPKFFLIKSILTIFVIILLLFYTFLLFLLWLFSNDSSQLITFSNFLIVFSVTTPSILFLLSFLNWSGKKLWLKAWDSKKFGMFLNQKICPNLNGVWEGDIESNYLDKDGKNTVKPVKLIIEADMFGFNITLKSLDGYQDSVAFQSEITKDSKTGVFYLSYIFESDVTKPEETDDSVFYGAGHLRVIFEDKQVKLNGRYWTNRAWQRGLNTAGIINVVRKK